MKRFSMFVLFLLSAAAFGAEGKWYASCEPVELYLDARHPELPHGGFIYVSLYKEEQLESGGAFKVTVSTNQHSMFGKPVTVAGLTVTPGEATLLGTEKHTNDGGLGMAETTTNTYALKLNFTADENIGSELHGDIGGGVKHAAKYAICNEYTSRFVH